MTRSTTRISSNDKSEVFIVPNKREKALFDVIYKHLPTTNEQAICDIYGAVRLFLELQKLNAVQLSYKHQNSQVTKLTNHIKKLLETISCLDANLKNVVDTRIARQSNGELGLLKIAEKLEATLPCLSDTKNWITALNQKSLKEAVLRKFMCDMARIYQGLTGKQALDEVYPGDTVKRQDYHGEFFDLINDFLKVSKWDRDGNDNTLGDKIRNVLLFNERSEHDEFFANLGDRIRATIPLLNKATTFSSDTRE